MQCSSRAVVAKQEATLSESHITLGHSAGAHHRIAVVVGHDVRVCAVLQASCMWRARQHLLNLQTANIERQTHRSKLPPETSGSIKSATCVPVQIARTPARHGFDRSPWPRPRFEACQLEMSLLMRGACSHIERIRPDPSPQRSFSANSLHIRATSRAVASSMGTPRC